MTDEPAPTPHRRHRPRQRARVARRVRALGNWINLSTPVGLALARLGGCRIRTSPDTAGVWWASGYRLRFPVAGAFVVGSVILSSRDLADVARTHPQVMAHEERHIWQWFACAGLPFLPLYGLAMTWSWLRTGHYARANIFEQWAGLADGGYTSGTAPTSRRTACRSKAAQRERRRAERSR